jgi:predicted transcriptional regulator
VQFLEEDLDSCVAYVTLKAQSQQVLEDFLVRNDIAPNPLCPDADGCYQYTGALIVTPEKPVEETETAAPAEALTDETIRAALLADYVRVNPAQETEDTLVYQTEAHRVLAREESGDTCTVYLTAWRATFTLTNGRYDMAGGDRIPTALTFTWDGGAWRLTEYWTPGDGAAYARDLREKFPPEAAEQELDAGTMSAISDELMEQCRADAVAHFTALTGSVPAAAFQPSDVEFSGQALETHADEMTYEERLAWAADTGITQGMAFVSTGRYLEGQDCLAALGQWTGTSHVNQYVLYLSFPTGHGGSAPALEQPGGQGRAGHHGLLRRTLHLRAAL